MSTDKSARDTPAAKASMLVATASGNMALGPKELLEAGQDFSRDSRIIPRPMSPSRINTIQ